jgi:hypothetical protein
VKGPFWIYYLARRRIFGERNKIMPLSMRFLIALVLAAGFVACDSMELTIVVHQPEDGWLEVANANDHIWNDARLVVEAFESEGTTRPCGEESVSRWEPGQAIRVPACAEKVRFTLTTGGETARFSYSNGQLYRRIGRKEVPISG